MSNQDHVGAVKKALDLTVRIAALNNNLSILSLQQFRAKPLPPERQIIPVVYPPIKPEVKFWCVELLPAIVFWPWIIIYYLNGYQKKKEAEAERIRNSPEYQQQCAEIDEGVRLKQHAVDMQHQKQLLEYQNEILPKYQKELAEWTQNHNAEIEKTRSALQQAKSNLTGHYEQTKIIPAQYRDADALRYIYDAISTSDYTVREAIDMYDRDRQRRLEAERIYEQQRANNLARQQNELLYEQNDLLDEQNAISERARRQEQRAEFVRAVQHHNTNKTLNKIVNKK